MTIKLNENCPCGSGKTYSKCCKGKKDRGVSIDKLIENPTMLNGLSKQFMKEAKFDICLHPEKKNCSKKIINAHTVQKSGVLSRLAVDGHVIMLNTEVTNEGVFINNDEIGKSVATTNKMFCKFHDTDTFKAIELQEYTNQSIQNFLYAYRAFASEYYKKFVQIKSFRNMVKINPSVLENPYFVTYYRGLELAEKDANSGLEIFNEGIINKNYSGIYTLVRELDFEINFAIATSFGPYYDLEGNPLCIDSGMNQDRFQLLFLNVFPSEKKSYILFSCFEEDKEFFEKLFSQFEQVNNKELIRVLNNLIPEYCESIVFSPKLWNHFSTYMKEELIKKVHSSSQMLGESVEEELERKKELFIRPPYNLFRTF